MSLVPVGIMQAQMRAEKKNLRPVLFGVAHVLQLLGCPNFIQTSESRKLWSPVGLNHVESARTGVLPGEVAERMTRFVSKTQKPKASTLNPKP